jgi:uncharacterized repeat protein (TIGR01451 family)
MKKTQIFRISIFAALAITLLFSNTSIERIQARPFFAEGMTLSKTASPMVFTEAGEEIEYTITVKNTSEHKLSNISITDNLIELTCEDLSKLNTEYTTRGGGCFGNSEVTKHRGTVRCTGTYTVTEADVAAGEIVNTASASATYLKHVNISKREFNPTPSDTVTVKLDAPPQTPEISLRKYASSGVFVLIGEEITYNYEITNLSDFPIEGPITVTDDKIENVTCPEGDLGANQRVTCTADYITTDEDYAAGSIVNHAVASVGGATAEDSYTVRWVPPPTPDGNPELTLDIAASPSTYMKAGDLVKFTFTLSNTGDMLLGAPFSVSENLGLSNFSCENIAELSPGQSLICTGWYVAKQSDMNAYVQTCATGHGTFFYFYTQDISSSEVCTSAYYEPPQDKKDDDIPDEPPPTIDD